MQMGASLVVEQDSGRKDSSIVMAAEEALWWVATEAEEAVEEVAPSQAVEDAP
jgi:hypothetical protein